MSNNSFISKKAKIDPSVKIGPFCYIGDNVVIEKNCILKSHVSIIGNTNDAVLPVPVCAQPSTSLPIKAKGIDLD